ncbi:MAG: Helix-turn-helix protein [Chthonomonadales bacterium]|nr:Helix-turn-helix protein [Chthonomonadales bacterium]
MGRIPGEGEVTPNAFCSFLRTLRQTRGLSLRDTAAAAGIARYTLIRWEQGHTLPRLPEFQAVLTTLGATPAEQTRALQLLEAPRAARLMQQETSNPTTADILQPHGGDLLRALRLRRGWTVTEAARQIGTAQNTVSRWEHGDAWPSPDRSRAISSEPCACAPANLSAG